MDDHAPMLHFSREKDGSCILTHNNFKINSKLANLANLVTPINLKMIVKI